MKKKTTKRPKTVKTPAGISRTKRRGRPRKDHLHGRKEVSVFLPTDLLADVDAYVSALRKQAPGASRGDVLSDAVRAFGPFRLWLSARATT